MEKRTPDIRFKQFHDDWIQRNVGELLVERNEQAPMSDEYPLMAFIANEGVAPKGERYDRSALVNDTTGKLYKKTVFGDFIYSSNNLETGSIGLNKYGKASISPVYSIFQPTELADSGFIGRRFVRKDFINAMVRWRQGVIYGQWRIHEADFAKIGVVVPPVKEQRKIGNFLDQLDNLISLQQNKVDTLTNAKSAMLARMFPKEGETEPEIRFAGFTGAWEQRKFGELCSIVTKQTGFDYTASIKKSLVTEASEDTLPYLQTKNFTGISIDYKTDYYIPKSIAKEFPKINLDEKCLLFSIVGASVGNIGFFPGDKHCFLSGAICVSKLQDLNNADYLYHYMCSECGQRQIRTCTKGGAQATITIEDIRDFDVLLPSVDERMKIGDFLTNLDNTITLHQRKLDKLKDVKKAMLNKMFV